LSARDRPYKGGRSIADVLGTMADMVREGHLDREVFGILLGGVWRRYAERYLPPDQFDDIDVSALLQRACLT
jgi:HD-GYP domain-containing protein (c-di-GMP phosphodiesterase class II)